LFKYSDFKLRNNIIFRLRIFLIIASYFLKQKKLRSILTAVEKGYTLSIQLLIAECW